MRAQLRAQPKRNNDATEATKLGVDELRGGKARCWRVQFPAWASVEVWFTPTVNRTEALAACGGAIDAVPIHDAPKRAATAAEADELRELIAAILPDTSAADRKEALTIALGDPDAALECFRSLLRGGA